MLYKIDRDLVAITKENRLERLNRKTRHDHSRAYKLLTSRIDIRKMSFFPRTVLDWNALPPDIAETDTLYAFKARLQTIQYYVSFETAVKTDYPVTMETLDHYYGFVLYEHQLTADVTDGILNLTGVRDRGYLMVGSKEAPVPYGIVQRRGKVLGGLMVINVSAKKGNYLHILVENMGRIGFGDRMNDNHKGLITNVTLNGVILKDWFQYPVTMSDGFAMNKTVNLTIPVMTSDSQILPSVFGGSFLITDDPCDTYIDMSQWTKGVLFINGMNMGRYWPREGPQVRLFVPKFTLQLGWNRVILIELEGVQCSDPSACDVEFKATSSTNTTVTSTS